MIQRAPGSGRRWTSGSRAVKIRQHLEANAPSLPIPTRIAYLERRPLSQPRSSQRRKSDMSSGRSLGLLCTNSLTVPCPLAFFAASARPGASGAELRGHGGLTNPQQEDTCFLFWH